MLRSAHSMKPERSIWMFLIELPTLTCHQKGCMNMLFLSYTLVSLMHFTAPNFHITVYLCIMHHVHFMFWIDPPVHSFEWSFISPWKILTLNIVYPSMLSDVNQFIFKCPSLANLLFTFWYKQNPNYPIEVEKWKRMTLTVDPCLSSAFK